MNSNLNSLFDIKQENTSMILKEYRGHQQRLVVPASVTIIGAHAFRRCVSLEELEIPETVRIIDTEAFNGCHGLRRIIFREGLLEIRSRAFWYCSALREIEIPASVTLIGSRAFECCSNLRKVNFKGNGTHVDEYAFNETPYYHRLTSNVLACMPAAAGRTLPLGTTALSKAPDDLVLPEGMTHIDLWAFCQSKIRSVSLPNSLRTIGMCAFKDCRKLVKVTMSPNTYCNYKLDLKPGEGIFSGCISLEEVVLRGPLKNFTWFDAEEPELLRGFDPERTFSGCTSLKRIIAWEIPLSAFPEVWTRYAVNGFLSDIDRDAHYSAGIASEYHTYLGSIRRQLINRTEIDHSYALHQYLIQHEMIQNDEIELLIERVRKEGAAEVTAALLTYQRTHNHAFHILDYLEAELGDSFR